MTILKLYKYRSLANLWHVLDIVINQRLYCAHWSELNDPLEGRYEVYLGAKGTRIESLIVGRIEKARNRWRVASLSADPLNFLLWSHYADGHKGVAIEVEILATHKDLLEVTYSPFSSVITKKIQTEQDMRHLFGGKSEEWSYEREFRLLVMHSFFRLPRPIKRIFLGPMVSATQRDMLAAVLPTSVELLGTRVNPVQGRLEITSLPTPRPRAPSNTR